MGAIYPKTPINSAFLLFGMEFVQKLENFM
jgi:hypothetical protein